MMYIVLVFANGEEFWKTYDNKEEAMKYAKFHNLPNELVWVYEVNNTKPIYKK